MRIGLHKIHAISPMFALKVRKPNHRLDLPPTIRHFRRCIKHINEGRSLAAVLVLNFADRSPQHSRDTLYPIAA